MTVQDLIDRLLFEVGKRDPKLVPVVLFKYVPPSSEEPFGHYAEFEPNISSFNKFPFPDNVEIN